MQLARALLALAIAGTIPVTSAWKLWINWDYTCGGSSSYENRGFYGQACINRHHLPGDKPAGSLTITEIDTGCTFTTYSDFNCKTGTTISSAKVNGACLRGDFLSYSVNC